MAQSISSDIEMIVYHLYLVIEILKSESQNIEIVSLES